jgi:hypothetical protein
LQSLGLTRQDFVHAVHKSEADELDRQASLSRERLTTLEALVKESTKRRDLFRRGTHKQRGDPFATIVRCVLKEPSSGRAAASAGRVIAGHLDDPALGLILKLIDLRPGIPMTWLLGLNGEVRLDAADRKSLHCYLRHFAAFQEGAFQDVTRRSAEALEPWTISSKVILTIGYSRAVALVLAKLAIVRPDFLVGVVGLPPKSGSDRVLFGDEDRAMEATLLGQRHLSGRVFRTTIDRLRELTMSPARVTVLIGAEAISYDGTIVHPSGRTALHHQVDSIFGSPPLRVAICEPYKVLAVPSETYAARRVSGIGLDGYDVLLTRDGPRVGSQREGLSPLRDEWKRHVDQMLVEMFDGHSVHASFQIH